MGFHTLVRRRAALRTALFGFMVSSLMLSTMTLADEQGQQANFVSHMQLKIQALRSGGTARTAGITLRNRQTLVRTYDRTGYQPIWTSTEGWQSNAKGMLNYLADLPRHGLDPSIYHFDALKGLHHDTTLAGRIHGDLLMSDAFVSLVNDLSRGATGKNDQGGRAQSLLLRLKPTDDPGHEFDGLLPKHPEYWALSHALHQVLNDTEEHTPSALHASGLIKPGEHHAIVPGLRQRLRESGDYAPAISESNDHEFTAALSDAVARFQARNGLDADGIIGPSTLNALNRSRSEIIDTISLNLERWRQAPSDFGDSYVRVNIAGQQLEYHHDRDQVLRMKVIVGRPDRPTPTTQSEINEIVFNPDWTVPQRIAVVDKLPIIKRNPQYLTERGYTLSTGWSEDAPQVDPMSVDWSRINRNNFPFVLRQQPGPENALGQVKFLFPNEYSVYLHDTPSRGLFDRGERLFSSGCVRLDEPMALAQALVRDHTDAAWSDVAQTRNTQHVRLSSRVPVYLQYWTAWVDPDGSLQLRKDVYQHDDAMMNALRHQGAYHSAEQLAATYRSERDTQLAALNH